MRDREFEKKVKQKMEELKFGPSASVWDRVEKELAREKRHRKPVFWVLPLFFLAAAGGFYLYFHQNNPHSSLAIKNIHPSSSQEIKSTTSGSQEEANGKSSAVQTDKSNEQDKKEKAENELKDQNSGKQIVESGSSRIRKSEIQNHIHSKYKKQNVSNDIDRSQSSNINRKEEITKAPSESTNKQIAAGSTLVTTAKSEKNGTDANAAKKDEKKPDDQLAKKMDSSKTSSLAKSTAAQQKGIKQQRWKFGVAGDLGVSTVFQNLFMSTIVSSPMSANYASAPPGAALYSSSTIEPGVSFGIGFHVQKGISNRWLFTTGLMYHYYTSKVKTGTKVDSPITVMTNSTGPLGSRYYYTRGSNSNYTNHYHFIELPVTMQYEFARIHKLHLAWEGGFSLSQLISSDELHFDNSNGVYFKASDQLNKTQFSVNTAVLASLNCHKISLQFGPQVQYGLTNMLKSDAEAKQHLFYGGLKIIVVPNRM